MIRVRTLCPTHRTGDVVELLRAEPGATHVVVLPGAAVEPAGDLVEADVARESVDGLVEALRALGIERDGGIELALLETVLSRAADRAEEEAPGEAADAVVWQELLARTGQEARLTVTFTVMLTIACVLGAVGVVTDSTVTVVGAMVLGPEFGPLAALAVAAVRRRPALAREAAAALVVGFAVALLVTTAGAAVGRAVGAISGTALRDLDQTAFVYQVGPVNLLVALLAGVAGMVALLAGSGTGVLVGVFISVTTVPAAGFAAVAVVLGAWPQALGSLAQLAVNVVCIVAAGIAVLLLADRRRRAAAARIRPQKPHAG
ncbi:DUF389 domain-containing protein [Actinomycetospora sp. TBRC 11914]|uniref:DUF389 domain-containing protein n=1 Tax=Actinomycetospora sp. TBRC 11914 TaxID=2729387 RepID=UPI00145D94A4|nr:DUF389 domain-containing protein [Actinomycetospora sp. TBRC 11914]NMO89621.1 DUF389 domain-containing protein [Actinomycetospora sp. TBRC 11914]